MLILFLEPVTKSMYSYLNDFEIDSRIKAKNWISQNIDEESTIASNNGCFQPYPFDSEKYNTIGLGFSSNIKYLDNYDDIDYLVIDSWFGDMVESDKHKAQQKSIVLFTEKSFNNLHFINSGGVFHEKII